MPIPICYATPGQRRDEHVLVAAICQQMLRQPLTAVARSLNSATIRLPAGSDWANVVP